MEDYEYRVYLNDYPNVKSTKKLTKTQKDVLSLLLFHGRNCDGKFTMCYNYIMAVLDISKHKVSIAIGRLEDLKFITVVRGHKGVYTQYTINYDILREFGNELSPKSEIADMKITDNQYEELSKRIDGLENRIKSWETVVEMLVQSVENVITEQRKLTSKLLGISRQVVYLHRETDCNR